MASDLHRLSNEMPAESSPPTPKRLAPGAISFTPSPTTFKPSYSKLSASALFNNSSSFLKTPPASPLAPSSAKKPSRLLSSPTTASPSSSKPTSSLISGYSRILRPQAVETEQEWSSLQGGEAEAEVRNYRSINF